MAKSKAQQNAINLDPTGAREKLAMNMSVLPGSPGNTGQNNNPMNVTSIGPQRASMDGHTPNPYLEKGFMLAQMGADSVNPFDVRHSPLQQNTPVGGRGFQANQPYGLQPQPDTRGVSPVAEQMEAARYNMAPMMQGKPQSAMGLTGLPAQPAPGAFPSNMPGTSGPGFMATENTGMTPGSTPQKINQKKKGGKA